MARWWMLVAVVVGLLGCSKESGKPATPATKKAIEIRVAVAASVKPVMPEIIAEYAKGHVGVTVTATYGASGTFAAQIQSGAPFDVFMSADMGYPQKLVEAGSGVGPVKEYAVGRLVVWARKDSGLDAVGRGLEILGDERVKKVAIANPAHAPYGKAAEEALGTAGMLEGIRPRLVMGESVEQAATFARTGAAEAAVLPRSQAVVAPMKDEGVWSDVPLSLYEPIRHGAVVLKGAADAGKAREFVDFLAGAAAQGIFARAGLGAAGN